MNQFDKIKQLIKRDRLSSPKRDHELVYRRAFLMHELRSTGMTLKEIGGMFKRDHATVLHSLRTHEWMTSTNDKLYWIAYLNIDSSWTKLIENQQETWRPIS